MRSFSDQKKRRAHGSGAPFSICGSRGSYIFVLCGLRSAY